MNKKLLSLAAVGLVGASSSLIAGPIPYPNSGTENLITYTFNATANGDIIAYFAGTGASYTESLGMMINGVQSANGFGLVNQTSHVGDSFDLGFAHAGDTLTFDIDVTSPNLGLVYSDSSLNAAYDGSSPGLNHVYSTDATAWQIAPSIPAGTYVGFEDLPGSNPPDWNYFDETYVFTDVTTTSSVPDSGSSMMLLGMAMTGLGLLRRKA